MHRRKHYDRENDGRSGYEQRGGTGEHRGYSGD
jgi:hypothetical protein